MLNDRIKQNATDYELEWLVNHYATWEHVFDRFSEFNEFQQSLKHANTNLPHSIDTKSMATRGQMGVYWNFMITFK